LARASSTSAGADSDKAEAKASSTSAGATDSTTALATEAESTGDAQPEAKGSSAIDVGETDAPKSPVDEPASPVVDAAVISPTHQSSTVILTDPIPAQPESKFASDAQPVAPITLAEKTASTDEPTTDSTTSHTSARTAVTAAADLPAAHVQISTLSVPVPPAFVPSPPNLIQSLFAVPAAIISSLHDVVETALDSLVGPAYDVPADSPVLWGVLAWVRRQINATFFNQAPTAAPVQSTSTTTTGPILGIVGGVDAEGDPLTYELAQGPTYGTVAFGPFGSYVYTPGADFTGTDSFQVKVGDTGPHLHVGNTGSILATVTVANTPNDNPPASGSDKPFQVINLSSHKLEFLGYIETPTGDLPSSGPVVHTTVDPGQSFTFVFPHGFAGETRANMWFGYQIDGKTQEAGLVGIDIGWTGDTLIKCDDRGGNHCGPKPAATDNWTEGSIAYFLNPPGTEEDISAADPARQTDLILGLCADGKWAACQFIPKGDRVKTYGAIQYIGNAVPNYEPLGGQDITDEIILTTTNSVSTTTGLDISGKLKLFGIFEAGVKATHSETLSQSRTFTQRIPYFVHPQMEAVFEFQPAVIRDTGDFIIDVMGSKFKLVDVKVDSPDPSRPDKLSPRNIPLGTPVG
jgi:hypothetical protein